MKILRKTIFLSAIKNNKKCRNFMKTNFLCAIIVSVASYLGQSDNKKEV